MWIIQSTCSRFRCSINWRGFCPFHSSSAEIGGSFIWNSCQRETSAKVKAKLASSTSFGGSPTPGKAKKSLIRLERTPSGITRKIDITTTKDIQFIRSFSEQNGVSVISNLIIATSGNTEAYALNVLELCLNSGFGWDDLKPQLVDKLVEALHFSNINVAK